jgi:hypothetical protein
VFFDLITIRFLLKYMARPLHFFGTVGALGSLAGFLIAIWMLFEKFVRGVNVMDEHGPLLVFAAVLIVAGVQLVALGLLGELQVRHFHEPAKRAPYTVDRVLRSSHSQSALAD